MSSHRFSHLLPSIRSSQPAALPAGAFMPCPSALLQGASDQRQAWMQQLYQTALAQAQAATRPSRLVRLSQNLLN